MVDNENDQSCVFCLDTVLGVALQVPVDYHNYHSTEVVVELIAYDN